MPLTSEEWFGIIFWAIMIVISFVVRLRHEEPRKKKKVYNRRAI